MLKRILFPSLQWLLIFASFPLVSFAYVHLPIVYNLLTDELEPAAQIDMALQMVHHTGVTVP